LITALSINESGVMLHFPNILMQLYHLIV